MISGDKYTKNESFIKAKNKALIKTLFLSFIIKNLQ